MSTSPPYEFWIGTWKLGGEGFGFQDEADSLAVLEYAFNHGIRKVDTAQFYAHGKSDRVLRKALRNIPRNTLQISSKAGLRWEGNSVVNDGSKRMIKQTCYDSLEKLGLSYYDTFYLHYPDPQTPLSVSIEALSELKKEGVIKSVGLSNITKKEPASIDLKKIEVVQIHHNPLVINPDLEFWRSHNINIVAYSPFESGLLLKNRESLKGIGKKDHRRSMHWFKNKQSKEHLNKYYDSGNNTVNSILNWYNNQPIDAIILGPRTAKQLNHLESF